MTILYYSAIALASLIALFSAYITGFGDGQISGRPLYSRLSNIWMIIMAVTFLILISYAVYTSVENFPRLIYKFQILISSFVALFGAAIAYRAATARLYFERRQADGTRRRQQINTVLSHGLLLNRALNTAEAAYNEILDAYYYNAHNKGVIIRKYFDQAYHRFNVIDIDAVPPENIKLVFELNEVIDHFKYLYIDVYKEFTFDSNININDPFSIFLENHELMKALEVCRDKLSEVCDVQERYSEHLRSIFPSTE